MKLMRNYPFVTMPEDVIDEDFDIYAETIDDEEAIETGLKPREAGFMKGFRKSN